MYDMVSLWRRHAVATATPAPLPPRPPPESPAVVALVVTRSSDERQRRESAEATLALQLMEEQSLEVEIARTRSSISELLAAASLSPSEVESRGRGRAAAHDAVEAVGPLVYRVRAAARALPLGLVLQLQPGPCRGSTRKVVRSIAPGSIAADAAGVGPGMVLAAVNGQPVDELPLQAVMALLACPSGINSAAAGGWGGGPVQEDLLLEFASCGGVEDLPELQPLDTPRDAYGFRYSEPDGTRSGYFRTDPQVILPFMPPLPLAPLPLRRAPALHCLSPSFPCPRSLPHHGVVRSLSSISACGC